MIRDDHDERTIRCRRLGHAVTFLYCRTQEGRSLCPRILDCWWEVFDVRAFLEDNLPPEEFQKLTAPPPASKVASLLDLIEQAESRKRTAEDDPAASDEKPPSAPSEA